MHQQHAPTVKHRQSEGTIRVACWSSFQPHFHLSTIFSYPLEAFSVMDVAMSTDSDPQPQIQSVKRCNTCKITKLSVYSNFKNCPVCRDKNRAKRRLQEERSKQRKLAFQNLNALDSDDHPASSSTYHDQNRRLSDPTGLVVPKPMVTTSVGVKRKAVKALHELDKEEQRAALAVLKNGLKQTVKGNKRVVTPPRITDVSGLMVYT